MCIREDTWLYVLSHGQEWVYSNSDCSVRKYPFQPRSNGTIAYTQAFTLVFHYGCIFGLVIKDVSGLLCFEMNAYVSKLQTHWCLAGYTGHHPCVVCHKPQYWGEIFWHDCTRLELSGSAAAAGRAGPVNMTNIRPYLEAVNLLWELFTSILKRTSIIHLIYSWASTLILTSQGQ